VFVKNEELVLCVLEERRNYSSIKNTFLGKQKDFCRKSEVAVDIQVSVIRSYNLILNRNGSSHVLHKQSWHGNSIPSTRQIL
jgi:hypothetical protein